MASRNSFKVTPMARAFFRHYEHKHQLMKQYLPKPTDQQEQSTNFTHEFTTDFF